MKREYVPDPDDYKGATTNRCIARRTNGRRCGKTALRGQKVCRVHGGTSPQALAAAKKRLADEAARKAASRVITRKDTDPATALLDLVQWTAGEVDYWRGRVSELDDDTELAALMLTKTKTGGDDAGDTSEVTANIVHRMYVDASDRLARYAALALKAGIEERRVRIAEAQGAVLAGVIRKILERLNLTPDQQTLIGTVVPEELRALTQADT